MSSPKLYLNQRQADQMIQWSPSLEQHIEVIDGTTVLEQHDMLKRLNQKRSEPDFKPNRKMRRQKLTYSENTG